MEQKLCERLSQILASFPKAGALRLMFQDEARFGRISNTRYCWAKRPMRPMVQAMLTHQYTYAYGAVSPVEGKFDSLILPQVNGACMQLFINEIAARYPAENIIMVLDGAGWHKTAFDLPENLRLHFLPPYSPELNPQEHLWDELREKHFHNNAFESFQALEDHWANGLRALELETVRSITAWDWIITSASIGN